ncbi:helix-turn-helix transcriptional regulator [Brevibacillus laterosporus]|uniref:helix-turn-helix transcriptional regulator n=1 Tax=Brevibacillus laterosporus TaxID=1465 RepID=UPI0011431333|nr:helix-turn-helix transcriptional regulator [Brevibacillus laterosporus]
MKDEHNLIVKPDEGERETNHMLIQPSFGLNFGEYLRHFRVNGGNHDFTTQVKLAEHLHIDPKKVSKVECDNENIDIKTAAKWCKAVGWYEGLDLLSSKLGLDPFGLIPVNPKLNENVLAALNNLHTQLTEALRAVEKLQEEERKAQPAIARGVYKPNKNMVMYKKEIADCIPAVKTFFYANERQEREKMKEIGALWNQQALDDLVAMPRLDELRASVAL